jgi:hypothetical protein
MEHNFDRLSGYDGDRIEPIMFVRMEYFMQAGKPG